EASQAWERAQRVRDEIEGEYRAVKASIARGQRECQEAEERLNQAHRALAAHPLYAELGSIDAAERDAWLIYQRQQNDAECEQGEQQLQALTRAEAELTPLKEALQQGALGLAQLEARQTALDDELARLAKRLSPLRQQREETSRTLKALLGEHASPEAWQQLLDTRKEAARQQCDQAIERCHSTE